ncbi:MAG: glycosyltransferase [Ruminococcus sp.]|nr:glycosyltransferase [Ruminococcus sp.]
MDVLISVIVPIYNVEQYVCSCVESICLQTYSNLEVILVDDGSTDKSGEICDELANKDSRIKVIHKKNGGLSDARNAGIRAAMGEYIAFVDGDDRIHPQTYEILVKNALEHNADISEGGYTSESKISFEEFRKAYSSIDCTELQPQQALIDLYTDKNYFHIMAWTKIYRKELFRGIEFPKGKVHEDMKIMYRLFEICTCLVSTKLPFYFVIERQGSITRDSYKRSRLDCWYQHYYEAYSYFAKKNNQKIAEAVKIGYLLDMPPYWKLCKEAGDDEMMRILEKKYREFYRIPVLKQFGFKTFLRGILYRLRSRG